MGKLSDQDVEARLSGSSWARNGESIEREWAFADFAAALRFVNEVGELAEQSNHHPDILLHDFNQVKLSLSTHSEGGLTSADFALAQRIDELS